MTSQSGKSNAVSRVLRRFECLMRSHDWTTVQCPAHKPSHTIERICLRCYRRGHPEGCPPWAAQPTRRQYERASEECRALAQGTNGNVPIQSVYGVLVRLQLVAAEEARQAFGPGRVITGSSNATVTWRPK